jgi:eukaryotic-like serine/threonine-protein kinase
MDDTGPKPQLTRLDKPRPEVPRLVSVELEGTHLAVEPKGVCPKCRGAMTAGLSFCTNCGETLGPDPLVGRTLDDRYEVVRCLGAGAMGKVYEVRHLRLGKRFAMKVIHRELTQVPEFVARFEREALSMSHLQHPNCISVTDFGHSASGELYLVMEFLEGASLADMLDRPLPVGTALEIARQILLGLQHAHQAGIVHRDVKPENVMRIESTGGSWQIKVVDFGIAKAPIGSSSAEPLTKAGVVFGTPQYMAPEQALGGEVGPRVDLYAVGVILWRMLTGRPLFEGIEGHIELLSAKISTPAPSLDKVAPGVFSRSLCELLRRVLERKPSERIGSAGELLEALQQIQREPRGGLADSRRAGLSWMIRVAEVPRTLTGLYVDWYRCMGVDAPSWRGRLLGLGSRRGAAVLGSAIAVVMLLCLPLLLLGGDRSAGGTSHGLTAGSSTTAVAKGPTAPALPPKPTIKIFKGSKPSPPSTRPSAAPGGDAITRIRGLLGKRDCREAVLELRNVLQHLPQHAEAHYLLGAALICRRQYSEGIASYTTALRLNPAFQRDGSLLEDAQQLLKVPTHRGNALELLAALGSPALPTLLSIASHSPHNALRSRAVAIVTGLGAANQIDWLACYSQDLRHGATCGDRKVAVAALRKLKDPRAVPVLRQARDERAGFWRRSYRNYCIRTEIVEALRELQSLP